MEIQNNNKKLYPENKSYIKINDKEEYNEVKIINEYDSINNSNNKTKKYFIYLFIIIFIIILIVNNKYKIIYINKDNSLFSVYIKKQRNFCKYPLINRNRNYEKKIMLSTTTTYEAYAKQKKMDKIYIFKENDLVSESIKGSGYWELAQTYNAYFVLLDYIKKHKIKNRKDITILDIGGNIGWYTLFFGQEGFDVITFEPYDINYYILRKNFCLDPTMSVTIINQGLYNENRSCIISADKNNVGDGTLYCYKNKTSKDEVINLTKLDYFLPALLSKNIVLMKIDVEGAEGKVIEGGIMTLTKLKIPFILVEYQPKLLRLNKNNPIEFLSFFYDNGYKGSTEGFYYQDFRDKNNFTQFLNETVSFDGLIDLFFIYKDVYGE